MLYQIQIDTISQQISHITSQLNSVIENTDSFKDGFSTFFTYSSLAASIVTVLGVLVVFIEISKRSVSNNRQKKIILDLLRHMMVNNAILEIVCKKRSERNPSIPVEGTLERFATLDDDMNLGKFSSQAKNYEKLHNLSLLVRNYNSVVCFADKHLHDRDYPKQLMEKELNEIFKRSILISDKLLDISKEMHLFPLTIKDFSNYARSNYPGKEKFRLRCLIKKESRFFWKKLLKKDSAKEQTSRYKFYIKVKRCDYYAKLDMGDVYDRLIDDRSRKLLY